MSERNRPSRRQALALSGAALTTAIAGCSSGSGNAQEPEDDITKQPLERSDWEDIDEIALEGYLRGWVGVEPDLIAGVRNPSILLIDGNEYDITWENGDGSLHNIAIWDQNGAVVGGNRTSPMKDRGQTQSMNFEATAAMHRYVCEPHSSSMVGHFNVLE